MLELRHVGMRYGGVTALDGVSFEVRAGEIVGLMGANGAGKTTLFEAIAGNIRPTSGDILLEGVSLLGLRPDQTARRGVARTFQIVKPFAGLSVLENALVAAMFGTGGRTSHAAAVIAKEALAAVGLQDRAKDLAGSLTLSGQKRLEIARAVATGAKLMLIDEVMAGLTPPEVHQMIAVLLSLCREKGMTLVIIEHVMRALMEMSDRIIVLHLGRCIAQGKPAEIAADATVSDVYFGKQVADA
jgi:branched-chain amino acid transport system ATP-binding protein